jgi:hypothetical protein
VPSARQLAAKYFAPRYSYLNTAIADLQVDEQLRPLNLPFDPGTPHKEPRYNCPASAREVRRIEPGFLYPGDSMSDQLSALTEFGRSIWAKVPGDLIIMMMMLLAIYVELVTA